MEIQTVDVDQVQIGPRLRSLDAAKVDALGPVEIHRELMIAEHT